MDQRIKEITERCEKATPGPWMVLSECQTIVFAKDPYGHGMMRVADIRGWGHLTGKGTGACAFDESKAIDIQRANAELISHARDDIPYLLARLKLAERERDAAIDHCELSCKACANQRTDLCKDCWLETFPGHPEKMIRTHWQWRGLDDDEEGKTMDDFNLVDIGSINGVRTETLTEEEWMRAAGTLQEAAPGVANVLRVTNFEGRGEEDAREFLGDMQCAIAAIHYVARYASDKCKFVIVDTGEDE